MWSWSELSFLSPKIKNVRRDHPQAIDETAQTRAAVRNETNGRWAASRWLSGAVWPWTERSRSLSRSWMSVKNLQRLKEHSDDWWFAPHYKYAWTGGVCIIHALIQHNSDILLEKLSQTVGRRQFYRRCRGSERRRHTDRSLTDFSDSVPCSHLLSTASCLRWSTHINVPSNGLVTGRKQHSPETGLPWLWQLSSPHFQRFRYNFLDKWWY